MNLRYGLLSCAICLLAACSDELASKCGDGVTAAIDEVVVRPVLFIECTYSGADVSDPQSGEVTLYSGTTIKADFYLSRPLLRDGQWVGFALFDEITGTSRELLFAETGARNDWSCNEPVSGDPVAR